MDKQNEINFKDMTETELKKTLFVAGIAKELNDFFDKTPIELEYNHPNGEVEVLPDDFFTVINDITRQAIIPFVSTVLVELGYRKIPENEAIQHYQAEIEALELELSQSHKIIKKLSKANGAVDWLDGYKKGFAEGVQAMQIQLKGIADQKLELYGRQMVDVDDIDSVCKELTEEKHENTKP